MASQAQKPLCEECRIAVNFVASYQLNVSDAYFTMTCYYDEDSDASVDVPFFQDQAVVKRKHAKWFIKYLKDRQSRVCLPVTKRPDAEYWGTDREATVIALQVERNLYKHLQELRTWLLRIVKLIS
ncbi:ferritin heavy chain A-like [Lutra lutra]|uniref:ferritin heavy chain A-like n=1 Tax=Lutra lutra TaxID=9657 RepID=UPI001FD282B6|nr:ferritin heavy chain A-like [Lutra lutra]